MNFSGISSNSLIGKLLRAPLKLVPRDLILPVLQGRLRGAKWISGSHTHGCWLGSYEMAKRRLFEAHVKPNQVVYDIGAHVGFYALLASRLVGPDGVVIAFEPLPRNLKYLRRHQRLNGAENIRILEVAVSDSAGSATFMEGHTHAMGALTRGGSLPVACVSIDTLQGEIPPPDIVKMDIEGGEVKALAGMRNTLHKHRPTIFLATHGSEAARWCISFLSNHAYSLDAINGETPPNMEFLCRPR
jgi:FkbM family methyltransferase